MKNVVAVLRGLLFGAIGIGMLPILLVRMIIENFYGLF